MFIIHLRMDHALDNTGLIPYDKAEFMKRSRAFRLEMYGKYSFAWSHSGPPPNFPDVIIDKYDFANVLACLMWNAAVGEESDFGMLAVPDMILMDRLRAICAGCAKCDCLRFPNTPPGYYMENYPGVGQGHYPHRKILKNRDAKKIDCICSISKSDVKIGSGNDGSCQSGFMRKIQLRGNCARSEYDITFGTDRTGYESTLNCLTDRSGVTYNYSPVTEVTGTVPAAILSGLILMVKVDSPTHRAAFAAAIDAACVWFGIGGATSAPPIQAAPAAISPPAAAAADLRAEKEADRARMYAQMLGDTPSDQPPGYSD
jgi:hypothetical protein